jgi:WD40 repeat protein
MRQLPWRPLFLAVAAGLATWLVGMGLWPKSTPSIVLPLSEQHDLRDIWHLEFCPDSSLLAALVSHGDDAECLVMQTGDGHLTRRIGLSTENAEDSLWAVYFNENRQLCAARQEGLEVIVRNIDTGLIIRRMPYDDPAAPSYWLSGRLSADEIANKNSKTNLRDITTGEAIGAPISVFADHLDAATPDGRILVYRNADGFLVNEAPTGKMRNIQFASCSWLPQLGQSTLSPDGRAIVLPGISLPQTTWFISTLQRTGLLTADHVPLTSAGYKLFDTSTGEELASFPDAHCAAFSPDGKTLALANGQGQIELWDYPLARPPRLLFSLIAFAVAVMTFAIARRIALRRKPTNSTVAPATMP